jgi:hypothetical protein
VHLRVAAAERLRVETIYVSTLVFVFEDWWLSPPQTPAGLSLCIAVDRWREEEARGRGCGRAVSPDCASVERLRGWAKKVPRVVLWDEVQMADDLRCEDCCASRIGVGGRSDNVFFFRPKRPVASSSSQSTTSSTVSTLPQADRRRAHQGGRGHAPALRLVRPRPLRARSPPLPMRRAGGQRREPLVLEEEHELDRDHREQWDDDICPPGSQSRQMATRSSPGRCGWRRVGKGCCTYRSTNTSGSRRRVASSSRRVVWRHRRGDGTRAAGRATSAPEMTVLTTTCARPGPAGAGYTSFNENTLTGLRDEYRVHIATSSPTWRGSSCVSSVTVLRVAAFSQTLGLAVDFAFPSFLLVLLFIV